MLYDGAGVLYGGVRVLYGGVRVNIVRAKLLSIVMSLSSL